MAYKLKKRKLFLKYFMNLLMSNVERKSLIICAWNIMAGV